MFTDKCKESQFYCSKPTTSSSLEEGSLSVITVNRRKCLLHLCHGCRHEHLSRESVRSRENFVPRYVARISRRQNTGHIPSEKVQLISQYIQQV